MLSLQSAYKNIVNMAKKQSQYQEMSLFDDSSFWEQPSLENPALKEQSEEKEEKPKVSRQGKREIVDDKVRARGKKQRLKVTFSDGVVICDVNATTTMIQVRPGQGQEDPSANSRQADHYAGEEIQQPSASPFGRMGHGALYGEGQVQDSACPFFHDPYIL